MNEPRAPARTATPMLAQFLEIKAAHADCLLFYRMGDFYELFFDDAVAAAKTLDIVLTHRGKHLGRDVPMCGVPVHSAESYLNRLIRAGHRVAVCEQTEDPAAARKRGAKAVVARAVVRIVTPGTLTEDSLLEARASNHLAALARAEGGLGLAWLDLSTGDFALLRTEAGELAGDLSRIAPSELLIAGALADDPALAEALADWRAQIERRPAESFDSARADRRLRAEHGIASLAAFGDPGRAELAAAGALLAYLDETQKAERLPIGRPRCLAPDGIMRIDPATRRHLELFQGPDGGREGSLIAAIDLSVTRAGGRLLAARIAAPLTRRAEIAERLDQVEFFARHERARADLRGLLRAMPDLERAVSRLALDRGGPRDLLAIAQGLAAGEAARALLRPLLAGPDLAAPPPALAATIADCHGLQVLIDRLNRALEPPLPALAREGGFVRAGCSADLDEQRALRDRARQHIGALERDLKATAGIDALKIRHNNVLGYFVEVSARRAEPLLQAPLNETFVHRQTMANAVRFGTAALADLQQAITGAADRALTLELEIFAELRAEVVAAGEPIRAAAAALARLDVAAAAAELAVRRSYCRPQLEDAPVFEIADGRHPAVEAALDPAEHGPFIANDCRLSEAERIWLLTGPNMAGKSTFLRQNAILAVLAQAGFYVPAGSARIGIVDRLASRVGAADDLARGRSTFMVEMIETAAILHQAGERSLVILDEIGRGTATYDGLAIAWATIEHLHQVNRCRALFATHFHELTALAERLDGLRNHHVKVREWQGEVVFLHEVAPGAADRSYGVQVAKLAGMPPALTARAREVLEALEASDQARAGPDALIDDLPLFAARPGGDAARPSTPSALEQELAAVRPDELSPRQALDLLYRLKALLD